MIRLTTISFFTISLLVVSACSTAPQQAKEHTPKHSLGEESIELENKKAEKSKKVEKVQPSKKSTKIIKKLEKVFTPKTFDDGPGSVYAPEEHPFNR